MRDSVGSLARLYSNNYQFCFTSFAAILLKLKSEPLSVSFRLSVLNTEY